MVTRQMTLHTSLTATATEPVPWARGARRGTGPDRARIPSSERPLRELAAAARRR